MTARGPQPLEAEGVQSPRIPLRPAFVLGIGGFGRHAVERFWHTLGQAQPALRPVVAGGVVAEDALWIGLDPAGGGLAWARPANEHAVDWADPRQTAARAALAGALHRAGGIASIAAREALRGAGYTPLSGIDVFVIADALDPLAQRAALACLDLAWQLVEPTEPDSTFTLLLGIDTDAAAALDDSARREAAGFVAQALARCEPPDAVTDSNGAGQHARLDWFYLLDVVDGRGQDLSRFVPHPDLPDDPLSLLAEVIAGFVCTLAGSSLRHADAYARTGNRQRGFARDAPGRDGPLAVVSCAAWVAPEAHGLAADVAALAARVLAEGVLGPGGVAQRREGHDRAEALLAGLALEPAPLRASLRRDDTGRRVMVVLERPPLHALDDGRLVAGITAAAERYERATLERHLRELEARAQRLTDRAVAAIEQQTLDLLTDAPGGVHAARAMLDRLAERLGAGVDEHTAPAQPGGWLWALRGPAVPTPDPTSEPDPAPCRRALCRVLDARPDIPALWVRYALLFGILAIVFLGIWPYLHWFPYGPQRPNDPVAWTTRGILVVAALVVAALAWLVHLAGWHWRFAAARHALIATEEARLTWRYEQAVVERRDQVQAALQAAVDAARERLDQFEADLTQVAGQLHAAVAGFRPALLALDRFLAPVAAAEQFEDDLAAAAAVLRRVGAQPGWPTAERVRAAALEVATGIVERGSDATQLAATGLPTDDSRHLAGLLAELEEQIHPLARFVPDVIPKVERFVVAGPRDRAALALAGSGRLSVHTGPAGRLCYIPACFGVHIGDLAIGHVLGLAPAPAHGDVVNTPPAIRR